MNEFFSFAFFLFYFSMFPKSDNNEWNQKDVKIIMWFENKNSLATTKYRKELHSKKRKKKRKQHKTQTQKNIK